MPATPIFIITSTGLQVASQATPTGPFIEIGSFKVGTAFGYEVTPDDQDLTGEVLFEGQVSSYSYLGDNIIKLVCKLPPEAGPFEFGEVGLYLTDGTLFAKAAFDTLQSKYSSLGTNLSLTYSFNCLLQLAQSVSVFDIVGASQGSPILSISNWSDIVPPEQSAFEETNLLILTEPDRVGDSTLLVKASPTKWSIASNYYPVGSFLVQDASATWVELAAAQWPYSDPSTLEFDVEALSLVVETDAGLFRSVASVQHIGSNPITAVRFLLNPTPLTQIPSGGSVVTIHADQLSTLVLPVIGGAVLSSLATNLGGGSANSLVYQAAADTTAFLAPGANLRLLKSQGPGSPPLWEDPGSITVGAATNATNATNLVGSGTISTDTTGTTQNYGTGSAKIATTEYADRMRDVPTSVASTVALAHRGTCIEATGDVTIPNGVMTQGSVVSIYNTLATPITLIAGITVLRLAGTTQVGNRVLAPFGMVTVRFRSSAEAVVMGAGLS